MHSPSCRPEKVLALQQQPPHVSCSPPPVGEDKYFTFVGPNDSKPPPMDSKQRQKEKKISRPANSFLLFRRDFQVREAKKLPVGSKRPTCASWSARAGAEWRRMSASAKKQWELKAATEKELHAQLYPDWKFQPNKRRRSENNGPNPKSCSKKHRGPRSLSISSSSYSPSSSLHSPSVALSPASVFSDETSGPGLSRSTSISSSSDLSWDFDVRVTF